MDLGRGIRVRLAGHVTAGLVSLAALPLLVRHLGVADFGRYVAAVWSDLREEASRGISDDEARARPHAK